MQEELPPVHISDSDPNIYPPRFPLKSRIVPEHDQQPVFWELSNRTPWAIPESHGGVKYTFGLMKNEPYKSPSLSFATENFDGAGSPDFESFARRMAL